LIADDSINVVVSSCVLNLVSPVAKRRMFAEVFRVLKPGGRAVISDIVSDKEVPSTMQADEELWSGCISGALREDLFVKAFSDAGFWPVQILERQAEPWRVEQEIDFRSITIQAVRPNQTIPSFSSNPLPLPPGKNVVSGFC
jgi:ubiquinone/menaquinone biosynthesis C-methylase UbiE